MNLIEIAEQKSWDEPLAKAPWSSFQQAWKWGEFQAEQGNPVKRFHLMDGTRVLAAIQLIYQKRRMSGYWFAPRGPVFFFESGDDRRTVMEALLQALHQQGLSREALFWRVEPMVKLEDAQGLFPLRCRRVHAMSPAATRMIDLKPTEEEILAAMHQKTRYNIRLAAKHNVRVREGREEDLSTFLRLTKETAERDAFTARSSRYLEATYQALAPSGIARLRLAEFEGEVLAANMEIAFGNMVTYLHGASSSANRNVMAPFLLQWEAMRAAKVEGYTSYDLWGCNPEFTSSFYYKPSWEGISRFKAGFGGELIDFVGTWDMPTNRFWYSLAFPGSLFR